LTRLAIIFLCLLASLKPLTVLGEEPPTSEESVAIIYQRLDQQISNIFSQVPGNVAATFKEGRKGSKMRLTREQQKLKGQYNKLKKEWEYWEPVYKLSQSLQQIYQAHHTDLSDEDKKALEIESDKLGRQLISATFTLKKEYKIGTFPVVHNLFLQMGLKKRGACKHWAEDLLVAISGVDHPHFTAYWAEAHPGNILEHNVAVLAPKGQPITEGLIIDPWRTAGKPFWIPLKDDNHPWQQWKGYEPR